MPEIDVRHRKAKRMPELILLLETLKSHIPDAKIVECSLGPIDGVQLLPKRCWCHVIKHHAPLVRHRLESWSFDKSCTMKIGPNLLVLWPCVHLHSGSLLGCGCACPGLHLPKMGNRPANYNYVLKAASTNL